MFTRAIEGSCRVQVSFDSGSQGQAALIMYEWKDAPYLGKVTNAVDETMPVSQGSYRFSYLPLPSFTVSICSGVD